MLSGYPELLPRRGRLVFLAEGHVTPYRGRTAKAPIHRFVPKLRLCGATLPRVGKMV